jgi:hypothetical protein
MRIREEMYLEVCAGYLELNRFENASRDYAGIDFIEPDSAHWWKST